MSKYSAYIARLSPLVLALSAFVSAQQAPSPQVASAQLDGLVRDFRFTEFAERVAAVQPSSDREYFAGVLANREGRIDDSIVLLKKALPHVKASSPLRAAVALHALADDYVKAYRYNDAISAYEDLLHHFAGHLDKAERQSTTDDYRAVFLLKDAPPQTISFAGSVDLPLRRNSALDTLDTVLTVNSVAQSWILDTGANFSTVSASFAKRIGAKLLKGEAQTQGITGVENKLQVAILPELRLGGAVVHNVVLLVLEDRNLNVPSGPNTRYQINAVLGYPVLHALQRITFTHDGHFLAGPDSPTIRDGARLFMNMLMPLLECSVEGRPALFSFDTGANTSMFSNRYYREFPSQFVGLKRKPYRMGGAGGVRTLAVYYLPHPQLGVGATSVTLKDVPVVPPLGTDTDKVFGNIGRDVTDPYRSFTLDFADMRFALGDRLPDAAPNR